MSQFNLTQTPGRIAENSTLLGVSPCYLAARLIIVQVGMLLVGR